MDWDTLRVLHAFADGGTLARAARSLGVDASTVSRRLQELERELEAQLFVRSSRGLELTASGRQAVACARQLSSGVEALRASVQGDDARLDGCVHVSCAEAFSEVLVSSLAGVRREYPRLQVHLSHSNEAADLRQGSADIAIRMFRERHDGLTTRKLAVVGWSLYASKAYVSERGRPDPSGDLSGHDVVGYSETMSRTPGAAWFASKPRASTTVLRVESTRSAFEGVRGGLGISALPCWMTTGSGLLRLTDDVLAHSEVFAVYLPSQRSVARVRVVVDEFVSGFRARRHWLSGLDTE